MLEVAIYNLRQHRQFQHQAGPLVLARSAADPLVWVPADPAHAEAADAVVKIIPREDGLALAMTGCEGECYCGKKCGLTGNCELEVPARFSIGDTHFEVVDNARQMSQMRTMERLHAGERPATEATLPTPATPGPSPSTLSKWFAAVGTLNHWATSLQELYVQAARSAVESIGLDGAIVLRRRDGEWEIAASHLPQPELGIHFDLAALDQLLVSPETMFHGSESQEPESAQSTLALDSRLSTLDPSETAVVIAPLRNPAGQLAGAIYGYRSVREGNGRRGIRYLEANLIELLAGAVSDGIARLTRESEVDRHRALVNQAMSGALDDDRHRLTSEEREVTLLFADLRSFTRLSSALANDEVYELLGHVMDCLTSAVMDHDGMVVDYYGDGLAAMWNAPADQAEHPELACRAALKMLESLPHVAADWTAILPAAEQLRLGIGIHTGIVQVGNAGSRRRKKYGPRGANVHLAARVEAATKKLFQPLVVSGSTAKRLSNRIATFRICRAQLPGIEEPVDLYAVWPHSDAELPADCHRYAMALAQFEAGKIETALEMLRQLDPTTSRLPIEFLAGYIERALGQTGRRSCDPAPGPFRGVISLNVK